MSNRDPKLSFQPPVENRRRDFFKLVGAGAAAAGALPLLGLPTEALAAPGNFRLGEPNPAFVLDPRILYMNIGTTGSTPKHILKAFDDYNREVARNPRENLGGTNPMREAIAPGFGATFDEMVMSYNTTDGMNKILAGVELNAGDEIVTTNHEHPGGNGPMSLLASRRGVIIKRVALPVGNNQTAQDYVDLFAATLISGKVKAFVFSAPTFLTGTMLPFKRLAALAQQHKIMTIVDGAHATGMFNLNFHETGIDFWGCSGHKWQCGPGGTGILYIRNRVSSHNPLKLFNFWPSTTNATVSGPRTDENAATYGIGSRVQSIGNPNYPMLKAFSETCVYWDQIGRQAIEEHDLALSAYLKDKISQIWGKEYLYSPKDDPELVSALTSFNPFHGPGLALQPGAAAAAETAQSGTFVTRLREEYGIVVRNTAVPVIGSVAPHHPLRISTHLFHSRQDVDRLVAAMRDLTNAMN